MSKEETYVVDTSVVIERIVSKLIKNKEIKGTILVPHAVLAELEHQANERKEIGFLGLEELQNLQKLAKDGKIELKFIGTRPNLYQRIYAKSGGEIDALIRDLAYAEDATLITADTIQAESAKALNVKVLYFELKKSIGKLEIEKFFDNTTMSVHLKEDCFVRGKKGGPGNWQLVDVSDKKLTSEEIEAMAKDIVEKTRLDPHSFIEISRKGSTIVQYKNYRIVIVHPPVSDGIEITAVRPLKVLNLDDYNLKEELFTRLRDKARGVVIAGETGSGKSTFAQALAEFYSKLKKVTKTIESPRDLVLSDEITQYSKNLASSTEIHDILFLSRPDYTIFDEMRDTPDFELYTDLRLGGGNVVGVLHAAAPIDAVQRFIGRIETGMIPSVLDTLLFIEKGYINKVLTLKMVVKVPSGMTEADLARPVVEVRDFNTNNLEFEIYSYGEETVVVPVTRELTPTSQLASKAIEKEFLNYSNNVKIDLLSGNKAVVYVPEKDIATIIGKKGKNIEKIEKRLGLHLEIRELKEEKNEIKFEAEEIKKHIILKVQPYLARRLADIYVDDEFWLSATVSDKGEIKINKKSKMGKDISKAINSNKSISIKA
ncbi:MAG: PINc/VapC family ATPase [Nanoarchaeota archaeon]